jgi:hypothetical protein
MLCLSMFLPWDTGGPTLLATFLPSPIARKRPNFVIRRQRAQEPPHMDTLPSTTHRGRLLQPQLGGKARTLALASLRLSYKHASSSVSPSLLQPTAPFNQTTEQSDSFFYLHRLSTQLVHSSITVHSSQWTRTLMHFDVSGLSLPSDAAWGADANTS